MRDSLALGFADVDPLLLWAEIGVVAARDCLEGFEVRAFIVSGAFARRGRVELCFFLLIASRASVGAVVMMDGAAQSVRFPNAEKIEVNLLYQLA